MLAGAVAPTSLGMRTVVPTLTWSGLFCRSIQEVEEDVVPEGHEEDEVERCPVVGSLHPVEEDDIPVLLCQNLFSKKSSNEKEREIET